MPHYLVLQPETELRPLTAGVQSQSPNHWTPRDFPQAIMFLVQLLHSALAPRVIGNKSMNGRDCISMKL